MNTWPATQKQRSYGMALERQLGKEAADWPHMTVDEAKQRISELITEKQFDKIVSSQF